VPAVPSELHVHPAHDQLDVVEAGARAVERVVLGQEINLAADRVEVLDDADRVLLALVAGLREVVVGAVVDAEVGRPDAEDFGDVPELDVPVLGVGGTGCLVVQLAAGGYQPPPAGCRVPGGVPLESRGVATTDPAPEEMADSASSPPIPPRRGKALGTRVIGESELGLRR